MLEHLGYRVEEYAACGLGWLSPLGAEGLRNSLLIDDGWSAGQLQSSLLAGQPDLAVLASHARHSAFIAPDGVQDTSRSVGEIVSSLERGRCPPATGCYEGLCRSPPRPR